LHISAYAKVVYCNYPTGMDSRLDSLLYLFPQPIFKPEHLVFAFCT